MAVKPPDQEALLEQLRANWAFEHLLVAVLTGTGVAAVLTLLFAAVSGFISGGALMPVLVGAAAKSMIVAFVVFLVGFLSGVLVVAPMFRRLERAKRRGVGPYIAASLMIAVAGLLLAGNLRGVAPSMGVSAPVIISSIVIAVLFARRVQPLWRASEQAEREAASQGFRRLH